ncbi:MAG TPA: alpha/beta fold hydrolase [Chloroflexia bacterium]|nr:alpha/beta fold hydrolase [Chloroflexia bacterium]
MEETMGADSGPPSGRPRPAPRAAARRIVLRVAGVLLALSLLGYLSICAYAADRFSHPIRQPVGQCRDYGLTCEDVQFPSTEDRVLLRGWFIAGAGRPTLMMLHGRDGRRDDPTIGMMDIARALHQHGYAVLLFDFRAHGTSGGDRYSLGDWERRDIAGALRYLQGRGIAGVGALGFSMGAATELRAAPAHPEMRALVLDSPFADLGPLIDLHLTEISGLPRIFTPGILLTAQTLYGMDLVDNRPTEEMAQLGTRPVLLIHSTTDDFIPVSQAYALQRAGANDPNLQVWFTTGPLHVRSYKTYPAEYLRRVIGFFDANLR